LPAELSDAKFLLLVDSTSGGMLGVTRRARWAVETVG
jgi:hypothetical protein